MERRKLGRTNIEVSALCLGTMTWGTQNTVDEAHAQIECALEADINFLDTAEMYPVNPISAETIGRTERIIGLWFERGGARDEWVVATKHSGEGMRHVRPRWTGVRSVPVACPMKARGAPASGLQHRNAPAARGWRPCRTNIRCSVASMTLTCPR